MYHKFFFLDVTKISHDEWHKAYDLEPDIRLHDDLYQYMNDTIYWIPTYNPSTKKPMMGLAYTGVTVIRLEGAQKAANIFQAWTTLFKLGSEQLNLRGLYGFNDENPDGFYDRLHIERDDLVTKLETLSHLSQKIVESNGQYFILHYGL